MAGAFGGFVFGASVRRRVLVSLIVYVHLVSLTNYSHPIQLPLNDWRSFAL